MYDSRDEISLRELYLIFRSGLLAIILVAIIAGLTAFIYIGSKPDSYVATATVQVNLPTGASRSPEMGWLLPPPAVDSGTYTTAAFSREVVAAAFDLPNAGAEALRQLAERLELKGSDTSRSSDSPLLFRHEATAAHPEEAASVATAWAVATAGAINEALRESFAVTASEVVAELDARDAVYRQARGRVAEFAERDEREELKNRIAAALDVAHAAHLHAAELEQRIASLAAQRDLLQEALTSELPAEAGGGAPGAASGSAANLSMQLRALVTAGALDEETALLLERSVAAAAPAAQAEERDLLPFVLRVQLETVSGNLAGSRAELTLLREGMGQSAAELSAARSRLAELEERAELLERDVKEARASYSALADNMPLVQLQAEQVGKAARLAQSAVPSLTSTPRNRATITAAAALVAGLLTTLLVFLRAAIRDPSDVQSVAPPRGSIDPASGSVKRTSE